MPENLDISCGAEQFTQEFHHVAAFYLIRNQLKVSPVFFSSAFFSRISQISQEGMK